MKAVDLALSKGASYAEARYHEINEFGILVRNGMVIGIGGSSIKGIAVRVLYRGVLSFASTSDLSSDSVKRVVEEALARARTLSSSPLGKSPVDRMSNAKIGRAKYANVVKRPFDSMDIDEKIRLLKETHRVAEESVREGKLATSAVEYAEIVERKIVVTSDGGHVESELTRLGVNCNIVVANPQKGIANRFFGLGATAGMEALEEWNLPAQFEEEARALDNVLSRGIEPPKEPVPVVLGSEVVGLIVHESCGHPMEADRVWGREAAQAGESFVKTRGLGLGSRIGNEKATVIDDPTIPGSFGFYLYDDECVAARPRYIYLRGVLHEFLHSRWSASLFNVESNAAARARDFRSEPIPRMSTTYLEPGDYRFEELLEGIKLGVFIKNYMEWNIDDERWSQRYVGLEAYLIRNGELSEPVRNPVLEFTTPQFYSSIEAKDRNLKFYAALCGKGEPGQPIPVWMGGPNVRLSKMLVGWR